MKKPIQWYMALLCLFFSRILWAQTGVMYLEENTFSSYVNLGVNVSDDLLTDNGQGTLEFWIKSDQPGNRWALVDLQHDEEHFMLRMQNENELVFQKGTSSYTIPLVNVVEHNQWYHVALTFSSNAAVAEVYVNSIKKGHFSGNFSTIKDLFFYKYEGAPLSITEVRGWNVKRAPYQVVGDLWTTYANKSQGALDELKGQGLVTFYGHADTSSEPLEGISELDRSNWNNLLDDTRQMSVISYEGHSVNGVRTDVGHPILSLDQILLTASKGDYEDKIVLEWPHIAEVESYQVFRDGTNLNITIDAADKKVSEKITWGLKPDDQEILPMQVHTYRVRGIKSSGEVEGSDDGFIFPNGVISGEIKTESEVYVEHVEVTARAKDGPLPGSALEFRSGGGQVEVKGVEAFRNLSTFAIDFWLKTGTDNTGTILAIGTTSIGFEEGSMNVLNGDGGSYLSVEGAVSDALWHHYTVNFAPTGGKLYRDGKLLAIGTNSFSLDLSVTDYFAFNPTAPSGTYRLDEFRVWGDTLDESTVNDRKYHIVTGTEDLLKLYYRFDLANDGFVYNQASESIGQYMGVSETGLNWLTSAEQPDSLAYGGFTNASGQYVISGIHSGFNADGMKFIASPRKPDHTFRPKTREVTLKRSLDRTDYEKTGTGFTDISALPIVGKVLYREGNEVYPVPAGQQLLLDGQVVTGASGAIQTDAQGVYSISAPLGMHTIAVNNPAQVRYFGSQSLFLQNSQVQSAMALEDRDSVTVSGWLKRGVFTEAVRELQTILSIGDIKLVLKDNERLSIQVGGSDVLVSQVILSDMFTFFAFSLDKPNGKISLYVNDNYQIKNGTNLTGLNLGGNLILGADGTQNNPESPFTGYMDQLEYREVYYGEANLSNIREGKFIETDEEILLLSYGFEESKGQRAISVTPDGSSNYLYWADGASLSQEYSANYTREYKYDYLASNEDYNPEGSEYKLNIVDPITDLHFDNQTRFGFVGNIVIPCGNTLGTWAGIIKRTDLQGFTKSINEDHFNEDNTLFKVDGLVPGSYQVELYNAGDHQRTIQSGVIDLTQGWTSADFEVRNPLKLSASLYEWDHERDTVGTLVENVCDGQYVLEAGKEYLLWTEVYEEYASGTCPVKDAEVSMDGDMGVLSAGFTGHTGPEGQMGLVFAANKPNLIGDYTRAMQLTATHDGRVVTSSLLSYNTGSVQENDNFTIEHPSVSMVLHDPPGDGSSLSLNQSFSFSHEYSYAAGTEMGLDFGFGSGADTEVFAGLGVISKISAFAQKIGLGTSSTFTYKTTGGNSVEYELDLSISTPADDTFTGIDADVYIGMGTVIKFGTGKTLRMNGCNPQLDVNVQVARFDDQTPFVYTHQDIKDVLLVQLELLKHDALANGSQQDVDNYQHQIDSWNTILSENESKRDNFSGLPDFDTEEEKLAEAGDIDLDQDFGAIQGIPENISFSGLTSQTYQFYQKKSTSSGSIFGGSSGLTQSTESYINGFSIGLTFKVSSKIIGLRENTSNDTNTRSGGYSFTLYDDDGGDQFNVDIKKDNEYGTPIFLTNAGQSMCPFESGTQPREGVELLSDAYDVHKLSGEAAVFNLTLRNTQLAVDNTPKRYFIAQDRGANPDGAVIRYNGDPLGNGLAIDFGLDGSSYVGVTQQLEGQLTITPPDHVTGDVSYENIPVVMYSGCEADGFVYLYHLDEFAEVGIVPVDTVYLSAYFHAPCVEEIEVATPVDNWVVNSTSGNKLELAFKVPGLTASEVPGDLTAVKIQYALQGNSTPNLIRELSVDTLQAYLQNDQYVHYTLDVSGLSDGDYQIRLAPQCGLGDESWRSSNPTDWISGSIYRIMPIITGVYPPENSVMTSGIISASYDREMDPTGANSLNVSLRGILGGLEYVPKSADFNALSDEIMIPHQEAIDLDGAYTLEFWVNPSSYANNGDKVPVVTKGNNYGVHLIASGYIDNGRAVSESPLVPFKWTHIAVVYDGDRNVKTYFDGKVVADASHIVQYQPDTVDLIVGDLYNGDAFRGQIDEIRIWNKARSAAEITTDRTRRLLGNEEGLMAYYVLDDIALEGEGVRDFTGKTSGTQINGITWVEKDNAAPIVVEKAVQDVPIDVILSAGDQLLITPKPNFPDYYLEGAELTAFIRDGAIHDLYGNPAKGKSWNFVINKNAVQWEENNLVVNQAVGVSTSFSMELRNNGGTKVTYEYTELPVWLTVTNDPGNGTLPYGYAYTMDFEVAEWLNPGQHETYVKVTLYNEDGSRAGVESFLLEVNVGCSAPSYPFDPNQYPDQVSMVGSLTIAGLPSDDKNDLVAAYLNGEVRGLGHVKLVNGNYLVNVTIYGYQNESGSLDFRVWDASDCKEYMGVIENYTYQSGVNLGTIVAPVSLTTGSLLVKSLNLSPGFHWVSFNLQDVSQNTLSIQAIDGLNTGDQISAQHSDNATYIEGAGWSGPLTALDPRAYYQVYLTAPTTLQFKGESVSVNTDIPVDSANTWVGYIPEKMIATGRSLISLSNTTAMNGDRVAGREGFAEFIDGEWIGSLTHLTPNRGYRITSAQSGVLNYFGIAGHTDLRQTLSMEVPRFDMQSKGVDLGWEVEGANYPEVMYLSGVVEGTGPDMETAHILGAFVGNECRGVAVPQLIEGKLHYFLTLYGEHTGEPVEFYLVDGKNGDQYSLANAISFQAGGKQGAYGDPYVWTISADKQSNDNGIQLAHAYPNPFSEFTTVTYQLLEAGQVQVMITDLSGRLVKTLVNGYQEAGSHQLEWYRENQAGIAVSSGVYLVKMVTGGKKFNQIVVVK